MKVTISTTLELGLGGVPNLVERYYRAENDFGSLISTRLGGPVTEDSPEKKLLITIHEK